MNKYVKIEADKKLAELKANFEETFNRTLGDGVTVKEKYFQGFQMEFTDDATRTRFEANLMQPVEAAKGNFGNACWEQFSEGREDWTEADYKEACFYAWAGGGFYSLPTVEYMERGTALFIAESQLAHLSQSPWICDAPSDGEDALYVSIDEVDELVIIPDDQLQIKETA